MNSFQIAKQYPNVLIAIVSSTNFASKQKWRAAVARVTAIYKYMALLYYFTVKGGDITCSPLINYLPLLSSQTAQHSLSCFLITPAHEVIFGQSSRAHSTDLF